MIAPFVTGCTPVGADLDRVAEILDHEAKRLGPVDCIATGNGSDNHARRHSTQNRLCNRQFVICIGHR